MRWKMMWSSDHDPFSGHVGSVHDLDIVDHFVLRKGLHDNLARRKIGFNEEGVWLRIDNQFSEELPFDFYHRSNRSGTRLKSFNICGSHPVQKFHSVFPCELDQRSIIRTIHRHLTLV